MPGWFGIRICIAGHQIILEVEGMQFFLDEKGMQFSFSFSFFISRSAGRERRRDPAIWDSLKASGLRGHGPTSQHNPNSRSPPAVLSPRRQVHCGHSNTGGLYGAARPATAPLQLVRVFSGALLPQPLPLFHRGKLLSSSISLVP